MNPFELLSTDSQVFWGTALILASLFAGFYLSYYLWDRYFGLFDDDEDSEYCRVCRLCGQNQCLTGKAIEGDYSDWYWIDYGCTFDINCKCHNYTGDDA